jgi:hypothetical protein
MVMVDELAEVAVSGDALHLRSVAQDWLRENRRFDAVSPPTTQDPTRLAVAAALVEMFAERAGQSAPDWTRDVGEASEPLFLLREAKTMKRLHKLCEEQSPLPLRRRRIYAPPNFLSFV